MENMIKISVIIPIYNAEKYLNKCLDSIISQTYQNLEIIAVDDGSTDNSGLICDQYVQKDKRIRVIHKKQGGVCEARNAGLDVATGDCITFVDNDDFILPDMYSTLVCNMQKFNASISMCSYVLYYGGEEEAEKGEGLVRELTNLEALHIFHSRDRIDMIVPWNKLYRRELFEGIRYPVGRTFDDEFITYKLLWKASKICFTDQKFYYFRQREDSVTHTRTLKKYTDYLDALIERNHYFKEIVKDSELVETDTQFCMEELCNIHFRKDCPQEVKEYYHKEYVSFYQKCTLKKSLSVIRRLRYFAYARMPQIADIVWQLKKKVTCEKLLDWSCQLLIVLLPILLFVTAACINKRDEYDTFYSSFICVISADIIYLILWISWLWYYKKKRSIRIKQRRKNRENLRWLLITALYTAAIRLPQFSDTQRWDGATYYKYIVRGCENFDFTLGNFIEQFRAANHFTWGYLGFLGIGEFLDPGGNIGIKWVSLLLTVGSMICVYFIFYYLFPEKSKRSIAIASCAVSSIPIFAGTFSYCNPDMGIAIFMAYMICFFVRRKLILMLASMVLVVTSKETGVLVVGGFVIGIFLWRILDYRGTFQERIRYALKEPLCTITLICGVVGLTGIVRYLIQGGSIWVMRFSNYQEFSTLMFRPRFIWNNIKQFLFLNMNWVSSIVIIIGIVKSLIRRLGDFEKCINEREKGQNAVITGMVCGYCVSALFFCLYQTYTSPRYHIHMDVLWTMFAIYFFFKMIKVVRLRNMILEIYGAIMLIQAYVTIDPMSLLIFDTQNTGNGKILSVGYIDERLDPVSEYTVYNHQYTYLNRLLEQVFRIVEYDDSIDILIENPIGVSEEGLYWDTFEKRLTYRESEKSVPVYMLPEATISYEPQNLRAVFLFIPQFSESPEEELEHIRWYYDMQYEGMVESSPGGGVIYYWAGNRIKKDD